MRFVVLLTFALTIPFVTSIRVTCTFQRGNLGTNLPNAYICEVQGLNVQSPDVIIEGIDGVHLSGHTHNNVTALRIVNQNCVFMPTGFASFFPTIEGLTITSSRLRHISHGDLSPFPNLLVLSLIGNRLVALDDDLFEGVPQLRTASFASNRIRSIPASLLDPLLFFNSISFENNVCINLPLPSLNMIMRDVIENCQNSATLGSSGNSEMKNLQKENQELREKLYNLYLASS